MLLVVTGASGAGKSTVRERVAERLGIESTEIRTIRPDRPVRSTAARQEVGQQVVAQAVELDRHGRHLLFCGDPFPPGEVLACPSADQVDIAVCHLHVSSEEQVRRLRERGEPEESLVHHVRFAEWMLAHVRDPCVRPEVIVESGWSEMVWDRWLARHDLADAWASQVIDTTGCSPDKVTEEVSTWGRRAVAGAAPVFQRGWHLARMRRP